MPIAKTAVNAPIPPEWEEFDWLIGALTAQGRDLSDAHREGGGERAHPPRVGGV
jgi:hypothetical protein